MTKRKIIGFAGRKRSGKTTLARYLHDNHGAVIITVADYLKRLCCELMEMSYEELNEKKDNGFTFDIVPDERWFEIINKNTSINVEDIERELKDVHITNIRQLLQVVGTDVIRKYRENWHVDKMTEEILSYPEYKLITVDDVRFPNEMEAILRLSGEVFFIVRPNPSTVSNHASETSLRWQDFDLRHVIINHNVTLDDFIKKFGISYMLGFDMFIPNSLLLKENTQYLPCANFGYGSLEDDFLKDVVEQQKKSNLFMEHGLIEYVTHNTEFAERYKNEIDGNVKCVYSDRNRFTTDNPLIVENLKFYI